MPIRLIYVDDQRRERVVRDGILQEMKFIPVTLGDHDTPFRAFDLRVPPKHDVAIKEYKDACRIGSVSDVAACWARLRRPGLAAPMPTISTFYGITIRMYPADHPPPHFHARYGEHEAIIDIRLATVLRGSLPRGALALTLMWAATHRDELLENWELCATRRRPNRIAPME